MPGLASLCLMVISFYSWGSEAQEGKAAPRGSHSMSGTGAGSELRIRTAHGFMLNHCTRPTPPQTAQLTEGGCQILHPTEHRGFRLQHEGVACLVSRGRRFLFLSLLLRQTLPVTPTELWSDHRETAAITCPHGLSAQGHASTAEQSRLKPAGLPR